MAERTDAPLPDGNRLLASLSAEEYDALRPDLEMVSLGLRQVLYEANEPIPYVYFVLDGVVSLTSTMSSGTIVEVATVGNEGMIGVPVFLGEETTPIEAFMQIPGDTLRMPTAAFRDAVLMGDPFRTLLGRYTQALMIQMAQGAVCNRAHSIRQRCARWLLMTRDRVRGDTYPLTQEFLGQMLGVGRPRVSEVESALQSQGLIRYTRGMVTVLDRMGLEAEACECYGIIRSAYDRLYQ